MENLWFVLALALLFGALLAWGFRALPRERWQIAASVPLKRNGLGGWQGLNITYYGLLSANAYLVAAALLVVMLASIGVPPLGTLSFALPLLSVCAPASRLMARWVEKKPATFTVAGAFFVGIFLAPWLAMAADQALSPALGVRLEVLPAMAALAVSYAFGEGLGRLACISFGCCYGKPLGDCAPGLQRIMTPLAVVFEGPTKKISYESHLDGKPVLPVQAMSAAVCLLAGLFSLFFFLQGWFYAALLTSLFITQGWRAVAESLRADYRGGSKVSAYQVMALVGLIYGSLMPWLFPPAQARPDLMEGLTAVWSPGVILCLQALWAAIVLYMGKSRTTASTLTFHVVQDRI